MSLELILISMRPKQWYKNLLLFVGIAFSFNLMNFEMLQIVVLAFIAFCFLSGATYILNDITDIEKDRKHPKKRTRPIASGALPVQTAAGAAFVLIVVSLAMAYYLSLLFLFLALGYLVLQTLYSNYLRDIVLIDILVIAIGFIIRAVAGAVVINVYVSFWLITMTFLLACFLALGKRRSDLSQLK